MSDLVTKARTAKRENRQTEFKSEFDPKSDGEWCEIIKDVAAISNSGGGVIVFGVNNDGSLSSNPCIEVGQIDHADLANRLQKYTGCSDPPVDIIDLEREGQKRTAFLVRSSPFPLVFGKPGTYDAGGGKQRTAFAQGTVYFRHGAKSEPGTGDDLRLAFDRRLNSLRESWFKNVKKVVKAPVGSEIVIHTQDSGVIGSGTVRLVHDPKATPVVLTRDPEKATGTFLHEAVSDEIFDEINNVLDANRILARGRDRFFLGAEIYYRLYAERRHLKQEQQAFDLLFRAGAGDFYAPNIYWALQIRSELVAKMLADVYLAPKGMQIHWFMRTATLLGNSFCKWVTEKWDRKWGKHSQPPTFYFTFKNMCTDLQNTDRRLIAARISPAEKYYTSGNEELSALELLKKPLLAESVLSIKCNQVFEGNSEMRSAARALDYLAHGQELSSRAKEISDAMIQLVGDRQPGDLGQPQAA